MKTNFLVLSMLLLCVGVSAQNRYISPVGANEKDGGIEVSQPQTTLIVDLVVESNVVLCGPYARYAQKFLGVRAPLTDKTSYSIKSAKIAVATDDSYFKTTKYKTPQQLKSVSHLFSRNEFVKLQPDKLTMTTLPLEDAAREAANTIFSLRKHRLDLITGEAGENVFGEGLKAALERIDRMEQEYQELFLGKEVISTNTERYIISPQEGKRQYILCRFSEITGLLSDTDLTGDVVFLQIEPSGNTTSAIEASAKEPNTVNYRLADISTCSVIFEGRELTKAELPVFEFGRTIKVALPRRK